MNTIYLPTLKKWHEWLEQNHDSVKEIWLIFYKKHTGTISINYENAVEEALCFGWIDSLIKRIDSERYARKFTPRTNFSKWSDINIERMKKLIRDGRMRPEGLAKISEKILTSQLENKPGKLIIPTYISEKINLVQEASTNFHKLAPSHKKNYINWIDSAKKEETRQRRLTQVIKMLIRGDKLGMK